MTSSRLLRAVLALRLAAHGQQLRRIVDELRAANPSEAWNYFAIDLGAGVRDADPVFDLFRLSPARYAPTNPRQPPSQPWFGVMVDGDPRQLAKMEAAFPAEDIAKRVAWIEPHTVVATLEAAAAPLTDRWRTPDVLKMDIDSFDCAVMRALLRELAPKVIAMEINVKFPPDVSFALLHNRSADRAPFDSERRRFAYGCSLRFQARHLMPPFGYALAHVDWNNAVYVSAHLLGNALRVPRPRDSLLQNWSVEVQDRVGYYDRPARSIKFGFNDKPGLKRWRDPTTDHIAEVVRLVNADRRRAGPCNYCLLSALLGRGDGPLRRYCWGADGAFGECGRHHRSTE